MIFAKVISLVAAGALFLSAVTTSAFAWDQISGNGAVSSNSITNTMRNTASISQSNNANFSNTVWINGNTGGNNASFNTGGNTTISTGSTSATVDISNVAGKNVANIGVLGCGCFMTTGSAVIADNGAFSNNRISQSMNNSLRVNQNNTTSLNNRVNVSGSTGHNSSSFNTGGSSFIGTGSANADVMVHNVAGGNQLGM